MFNFCNMFRSLPSFTRFINFKLCMLENARPTFMGRACIYAVLNATDMLKEWGLSIAGKDINMAPTCKKVKRKTAGRLVEKRNWR